MGKIRVGLLFGGRSVEHEVSLSSATSIFHALDSDRYDVTLIAVDPQGRWRIGAGPELLPEKAVTGSEVRLPAVPGRNLVADSPSDEHPRPLDVVFPIIHGRGGEDGSLQGLLNLAEIPYVGSGVLSSAVQMDKDVARRLLAAAGLPVVIVNPSTPIGPRDVKPTPTGRMVVEAAAGRMPAFVDTGLNLVHVDDVAAGHLLAFEHGAIGERYILGGHDMSLGAILAEIAVLAGRKPPKVKLPHGLILPFAYAAEGVARLTGREPFATVDGIRMARKKMYFSSGKAIEMLGYRPRPAIEALRDAVDWFRANGYLD